MVLLSNFPSLAVILSITLCTCNHIIVTIVSVFTTNSLLHYLDTQWLDLFIPGVQYAISAASQRAPQSPPVALLWTLFWVAFTEATQTHPLWSSCWQSLRILRWDLQQLAGALQRDVVVELGGGQQVVLDHGVLQDRHPVRHHRLLVSLQHYEKCWTGMNVFRYSMNSFQNGMNSFRTGMNSFRIDTGIWGRE